MTPDIIAEIQLYSTDKGGRQGPTPPLELRCLFFIDDKILDCVLVLLDPGSLSPGQKARVPIAFLSPDLARELMVKGSHFKLRELRIIGEGVVVETFFHS